MADDSKDSAPTGRITYLSVPLLELSADREFPGALYMCLHHKMVRYRNKGDKLDADTFNRLVYNHVKMLFIEEADREAYTQWIADGDAADQTNAAEAAKGAPAEGAPANAAIPEEAEQIVAAAAEQRRAMMDIFESPKDDRQVKVAIETSKKLVSEFLKKPFAINNIQAMQKYSKGCVDHSVNVSVLSVFLGLRMGYSHQLILENLAMGGLLHDIGKTLIEPKESGMTSEDDPAMKEHPKLAMQILEKSQSVSNEARMIVAQHHEFLDGTGYPNKLKGLAVYDLARLVAIANIYDNLVSESAAQTMKERAEEALGRLESEYQGKLDPKKLEKVIKILRYSLL